MAQSLSIQKVSKSWHERIVDMELENPEMKLGDIAKALGVTASHLSVVRNSEAFIEYRALRMREHQEHVSRGIVEKTQKVAALGLDVLHDRIEKERDNIPLGIVKDATELTLKSLGYGPKPVGVNVNVDQRTQNNHYHVSEKEREAFNAAREKVRAINERNTQEIEDAEVVGDSERERSDRGSELELLEADSPHSAAEDFEGSFE